MPERFKSTVVFVPSDKSELEELNNFGEQGWIHTATQDTAGGTKLYFVRSKEEDEE